MVGEVVFEVHGREFKQHGHKSGVASRSAQARPPTFSRVATDAEFQPCLVACESHVARAARVSESLHNSHLHKNSRSVHVGLAERENSGNSDGNSFVHTNPREHNLQAVLKTCALQCKNSQNSLKKGDVRKQFKVICELRTGQRKVPGKCIQVKVRRPLDGPTAVGEELQSDHRRALEEVHVEARESCNDTVSGEWVLFFGG